MRILRPFVIGVLAYLLCAASVDLKAQLVSGGEIDGLDLPPDSLHLKEEWWLGCSLAINYSYGFGTMSVRYVGGTAPDAGFATAQTQGGYGFGCMAAPTIEFRPRGSALGFALQLGADYQFQSSRSEIPVSNEPYAVNALFEVNSNIIYGAVTILAKYQTGIRGFFIAVGPTISLPLFTDSYLWQHEVLPEGGEVGEEPGYPNTSIKFDTAPEMRPRIGLQIGAGIDIMTGLFGYTGQLVTPYIVLQGATPVVSNPTPWNSVMLRAGVMWRTGI